METAYGKRLHRAARQEFRKFWSDYRCWVIFVTVLLVPIALQVVRHGVRSVLDPNETLQNGLVGLVVSLIGTYLIAVRKGAESIHTEQESVIRANSDEIERLNGAVAKPKRTPAEEHHYETARAGLAKCGDMERAVLRLVHSHGEMRTADWHLPQPNPEGLERIKVRMILDALEADHLVVMHLQHGNAELVFEEIWTIPPAIRCALDELLYAESNSDRSQT